MNGQDIRRVAVIRHAAGSGQHALDEVAVEEPLELRLVQPGGPLTLAVLMRTPGHDRQLLLGWLASEGLLPDEFKLVPDVENGNIWYITASEQERLAAGARLSVSSSACGVCGTGSIERLAVRAAVPKWQGGVLSPTLLAGLPEQLTAAQRGFQATGGLHAAALLSETGELLCIYEDVGRHNAVDKAVGWLREQGREAGDLILAVSSRAGFEIVQKAVSAGISVVVAVGAASSLAVDTAEAFGVTLCAFVREGRLSVYSGAERLG